MRIGISCYSTFGGSGVVATEVGEGVSVAGTELGFDDLLTVSARCERRGARRLCCVQKPLMPMPRRCSTNQQVKPR